MKSSTSRGSCSGLSVGYNPTTALSRYSIAFYSSNEQDALIARSRTFAIPVIATVTLAIAWLFATAAAIKPTRVASLCSSTIAAVTFILTVAAIPCIFGMFYKLGEKIPNTMEIGDALSWNDRMLKYKINCFVAPAAWALVAALPLQFLGMIFMLSTWRVLTKGAYTPLAKSTGAA